MIDNNDPRRLGEVIECRFLNPDGVGLILERLSQPEVVRLFHWFLDEGGCKAGNLLLENAPLFDTAIEIQADLPPFACSPATADSSDEDGLGSPGEPGQEEEAMHREGNSPQMLSYGFFGVGLMWGTKYLESVASAAHSPFPPAEDITDFLAHIFSSETSFFSGGAYELADDGAMSPAFLTLRLVEAVPGLDVVIRSAYRLSTRCEVDSGGALGCGVHFRFLFLLGLLASGLGIPGLSWQACYVKQAS